MIALTHITSTGTFAFVAVLFFKLLNRKVLSGIFIVNFEHISHLVLVFLYLTLNM